jgi:N-acetyl-gamma-glutamyl-phosphate reductase
VIHAGIVGASGYSGMETARLLLRRNDVRIDVVTAASSAGQRLDMLAPALAGRLDLTLEEFHADKFAGLDVAFVALPSGEGMNVVPLLVGRAARVIDLGGDFRLQSTDLYRQYYRHQHTAAALLPKAVYGLPELHRTRIAEAELVANPGCYATGAILGLLPALAAKVVAPEGIVITSASGTSGAGRSGSVDLSFSEVNENMRAYKVGVHQHIPEIETVLATAAGGPVSVSFVPHLLPITRGIYTTMHATLLRPVSQEEVLGLFVDYFRSAPFVRVRRDIPQIAAVTRTNYCDIGVVVQERTQQLIVMTTIDNLVKGAAGQAVQNMNIMFGLAEELGLAS